ncbi:MAG: TIGR01777 family protein [Candidatus Latescibacteria bacterium]|nr:TIGR01777 family protein [Candidatus Latescibacterota bacterium]
MNVLVTGSTGLVGLALVPSLTAGGHRVTRLVRSQPGEGEVRWDPEAGILNAADLEGLEAVVHLAGENIAGRRWTAEQKARIRDSRVKGTRLLCETLAGLDRPPGTLVCASAIGYYGDRGEEVLREESAPGEGLLPEVCQAWEGAAAPARQKGIRVVNLRFGVVLSPKGGALAKMLFPFRMGAGGVIGSGRQYMSWIALDDAAGVIHHALGTGALRGPANAVTPHPVTNQTFTKTLGRVLGRPTIFPMPAFAARLAFGEVADALLLASTRVAPGRLLETGYVFRYPELEGALRHLLGK